MKSPSIHCVVSALLLASSAIAAPSSDKRAIPGAVGALQAVQQCNDGLQQGLVSECWDTLKVEQFMTEWQRNSTSDCAVVHGDGSNCCVPPETWSTCFLRMATGSASTQNHCDQLTTNGCTRSLLGPVASDLDPKIKAAVQYATNAIVSINSFFTTYSSGTVSRSIFTLCHAVNPAL